MSRGNWKIVSTVFSTLKMEKRNKGAIVRNPYGFQLYDINQPNVSPITTAFTAQHLGTGHATKQHFHPNSYTRKKFPGIIIKEFI